MTVAQIAEKVEGTVVGDGTISVSGLAAIRSASGSDLTFADTPEQYTCACQSAAGAILARGPAASATKPTVVVSNPRRAMSLLASLFYPADSYPAGVHPTAVIDPSACVSPTAHIGPYCVIGAGVTIGAGSCLLGGNHVGRDCRIGADVVLFPNVVLYPRTELQDRVRIHAGTVIGSDGYGYSLEAGRHEKVPHVGNVSIGPDVEIGANAAVDRGTFGSTVIGKGSKIDNLVHLAHNVEIGQHCLILGQVGIAGSTHLSDYCVVASQAGIAGHLQLGQGAVVAAKSGVMRNIEPGGRVLGIPALPDRQTKRQWIALQQLPELLRKLKSLQPGSAVSQDSQTQLRPSE